MAGAARAHERCAQRPRTALRSRRAERAHRDRGARRRRKRAAHPLTLRGAAGGRRKAAGVGESDVHSAYRAAPAALGRADQHHGPLLGAEHERNHLRADGGASACPVAQLTNQQTKLQAEQTQLARSRAACSSSPSRRPNSASPSLFETSQTVSIQRTHADHRHEHHGRRGRRLRGERHAAGQLRAAHLHLREPRERRHDHDRRAGNQP